jgi:glycosyltransferase involved in cell wall biosynthesis
MQGGGDVADDQLESRPAWSVMIPAYEGAGYLEKTLHSVLAQDAGRDAMQIEVLDDCSPREDLRAVVERVGNGRVGYFRHPRNVGAIANFNTCVERGRGRWVHILHADDMVLPGFYDRLGAAMAKPEVGAAYCRHAFMDEDGHWNTLTRLERKEPGVLDGQWVEELLAANQLQMASVVVRRSVYEEIGGFDSRLVHAADWDMWKRIAIRYPVWFDPAILACYRVHAHSDTTRLARTGRNIEDTRRAIALMEARLPRELAKRVSDQARRRCAHNALATAHTLLERGDTSGARAQAREALKTSCSAGVLRAAARLLLRGVRRSMVRAAGGRPGSTTAAQPAAAFAYQRGSRAERFSPYIKRFRPVMIRRVAPPLRAAMPGSSPALHGVALAAAQATPVPTVSVVMSVYNGERFLREAVESILSQTFRDFEFIIINDGSTDGTASILAEYERNDPRVQVYPQENRGLIESLNRGCGLARGKYIARMDADDVALPDRLAQQVAFLEERPEIAVLGSAFDVVDACGRRLTTVALPLTDRGMREVQKYTGGFQHSTVLMRQDAFQAVQGYRKPFRYNDDHDLWFRLMERYQGANLPDTLMCYRTHPDQMSISVVRQQTVEGLVARAAAEVRRRGEPDPLSRSTEITAREASSLGITEGDTRKALVATYAHRVSLMWQASEVATTVQVFKELLGLAPRREIPKQSLFRGRLAEASLYYRQRKFSSAIVPAGQAALWRCYLLAGDAKRSLLGRLKRLPRGRRLVVRLGGQPQT